MSFLEHRVRCVGLLLLTAFAAPQASAQVMETDDHITTRLTEGVYAIRHKRAARMGALSGNTTVVVGDQGVLVVDSCLLPSIARDDIALIWQWTDKPVRYLVNTHWHGDHTYGNGVYIDTFPGLAVIGHRETAREMQGYLPHFIERNKKGSEQIKRVLESGKTESGVPLTEAQRAQLQADIPRAEARAVEYQALVPRPPNLTFEKELHLDLGNREVQIKHLGRGRTAGDTIVYLPREKVVVAGDLLVYPFPFLIGGFPTEWSKTLERVSLLESQTIVPGHGAVLTGDDARSCLGLVRDLLKTVTAAVRKETYRLGNASGYLDAVKDAVVKYPEIAALRERFPGAYPTQRKLTFDGGLPGLITSAYREAWGN
jgi:glyoxylase-like metal-dependent hydrolase (beta-lactamase superfamily II)